MGARVAKRLMTDCYARGVVRGAVETTNLILHNDDRSAEDAESIRTAPTTDLPITFGVKLMDAAWLEEPLPQERTRLKADDRFLYRRYRGKPTKRPSGCPWWTAYGHRGLDRQVAMLSPYEFAMYFSFKQIDVPCRLGMSEDRVRLTRTRHCRQSRACGRLCGERGWRFRLGAITRL
eukprot:4538495-Amphidinium_carterae.1